MLQRDNYENPLNWSLCPVLDPVAETEILLREIRYSNLKARAPLSVAARYRRESPRRFTHPPTGVYRPRWTDRYPKDLPGSERGGWPDGHSLCNLRSLVYREPPFTHRY